MKRKYFLRGLGAGIILSAVVMGVTSSKADLTDAEIRKRAMELGMVEKPDALEAVLKETKIPSTTGSAIDENNNNNSETEKPEITDFPTITSKITYKPSHIQNNIIPKATQNTIVTEPPKVTQRPSVTSKAVSQTSIPRREIISVTITAGMWSDQIAEKFKELGLVDSAKKFDKFLCDNDYASLIRVGSYRIPKGSSYEEIAKIITK